MLFALVHSPLEQKKRQSAHRPDRETQLPGVSCTPSPDCALAPGASTGGDGEGPRYEQASASPTVPYLPHRCEAPTMGRVHPVLLVPTQPPTLFIHHQGKLQGGSCFLNEETEPQRKEVARPAQVGLRIFERLGHMKAWEWSTGLLTPSPVPCSQHQP